MRTRDLALYISRKSGRGQALSWRVRAMLSTLLLLFISFALAFSIVLIESMAQGLDDVLQLLGGGSVIAYDRPDDGLLGSDDHVFRFQTTSALASSGTDSALVTLTGILFYLVSFGENMDKIIIGSIIPLLPGVPLTNSIRDFLNGDYLSGTIRMIDAVLVACCIALGVGVVLRIFPVITGISI